MATALGLVIILAWIAGTIALAAAVTWTVVKLTPGGEDERPQQGEPAEA